MGWLTHCFTVDVAALELRGQNVYVLGPVCPPADCVSLESYRVSASSLHTDPSVPAVHNTVYTCDLLSVSICMHFNAAVCPFKTGKRTELIFIQQFLMMTCKWGCILIRILQQAYSTSFVSGPNFSQGACKTLNWNVLKQCNFYFSLKKKRIIICRKKPR